MELDKNLNILIVGLGLMGGSYARALTSKGYKVKAIDTNQKSIDFALQNKFIIDGSSEVNTDMVSESDLIIFAVYPHAFIPWIEQYKDYIKKGAIITDVTGVKSCVVYAVQRILGDRAEFVAAHPMAGKETSGVESSDESIFENANYIVVPTDVNTFEAIETIKAIGQTLGFARISSLPPKAHDEMIGFVSQLTHCIAVCLMTCSKSEHLVDYTGDSFRDLTRIARINENMWSELFLLNKEALLKQMKTFMNEMENFYTLLESEDVEAMKDKMRLSTERRELFNKPAKGE